MRRGKESIVVGAAFRVGLSLRQGVGSCSCKLVTTIEGPGLLQRLISTGTQDYSNYSQV